MNVSSVYKSGRKKRLNPFKSNYDINNSIYI